MAITQKINNAVKQYGVFNFFRFTAGKLFEKAGFINETYLLYEQSLANNLALKKISEEYYYQEFSSNGPEEQFFGLAPERVAIFKERLRTKNSIGLGIYSKSDHKLVYYFWVRFDKIEFPEHIDKYHSLHLAQNEAYLFDGYCHPDHRGRGFHGFAAQYLMIRAKEAGKTNMVTIIRSINRAAIVSQEKVGFRPVKEIRFAGFRSNISCTVRNL